MSSEVFLAAPPDFSVTVSVAAGAVANATQAAPAVTETLFATGIEFSLSVAPAAAVTVSLIADLTGTPVTLWQVDMPAAASPPQYVAFKNPLRGVTGKSLTLQIAAPGGAVVSKANLRGFQRTVN
jgi:hypothetical protein